MNFQPSCVIISPCIFGQLVGNFKLLVGYQIYPVIPYTCTCLWVHSQVVFDGTSVVASLFFVGCFWFSLLSICLQFPVIFMSLFVGTWLIWCLFFVIPTTFSCFFRRNMAYLMLARDMMPSRVSWVNARFVTKLRLFVVNLHLMPSCVSWVLRCVSFFLLFGQVGLFFYLLSIFLLLVRWYLKFPDIPCHLSLMPSCVIYSSCIFGHLYWSLTSYPLWYQV